MDSDEELFPINDFYSGSPVFRYNDPHLVSGVLRAVVTEDLDKIEQLVRSGQSVNINDNNGNTPLHVAVIKKNVDIVKYLLAEEDIVINARNFLGQTPLFIAVNRGNAELAQCLIDNGANVNLPNHEDVTPLHESIQFPNIAHVLITNGANIDISDYSDDTPLHEAVNKSNMETVCMLLYYNADANRRGGNNMTPFMISLVNGDHALQEVLFEYVDDFNASTHDGLSTLALALTHGNHSVEELIKRGAKVDKTAYEMCLNVPNPENFKLIWKNMHCEEAKFFSLYDLENLLYDREMYFQSYINIIMEYANSSIIEIIAAQLISGEMKWLVNKFAQCNLNLDMLTKFMCFLLQNGYQISGCVINEVFVNYGYCELFKILLFMDYVSDWTQFMITARLIFDIKSNMRTRCREISFALNFVDMNQLREEAIVSFQYWVYRPLIGVCQNLGFDEPFALVNNRFSDYVKNLPKLPSLLELARNKTREHIVKRLNLSSTCQYYTLVNHLNISSVYKKILMFEKKLYNV